MEPNCVGNQLCLGGGGGGHTQGETSYSVGGGGGGGVWRRMQSTREDMVARV